MLSDYGTLHKTDLRIRKTERALVSSMSSILTECRFTKLTVDRLCSKAQLSRATFYSHFLDKYDLLEFWLLTFWTYKVSNESSFDEVREIVNQFIDENKKIVKNLLIDADQQTLEVFQRFLFSVLDINTAVGNNTAYFLHDKNTANDKNPHDKYPSDKTNAKRNEAKSMQKSVVMGNLYVGGIIHYLLWQVRNNFPPDVPVINEDSFAAIKRLRDWTKEQ